MGRSPCQVYKVVTPTKNDETGEICEDLICIKCNSHINEETGEVEERQKNLFKIPIQKKIETKKKSREKMKSCEMCKHGKQSLIFLLVTIALLLPTFTILFYVSIETLLHGYNHSYNTQIKRAQNFRNKLHSLFYSQFCAVCQSEKCMDRVSKLQDERLAKMRKYVKNIPIQ